MTHLLLFYDYVEDVLERRAPHREAHLARLREEREAGRVVMAGALGDPPHGAAIAFRGVDADAVAAFVHSDPYVEAGLVRDWRVEPWNVVVDERSHATAETHANRRRADSPPLS